VYLQGYTNLFDKSFKNMLHIAPEECLGKKFKEHLKEGYISIDQDRKRAMFYMDITNIQFKDETFEAIYCSHVLEHITNDSLAISEMARVLRKDGFALISVPISNKKKTYEDFSIRTLEGRKKAFGQNDHVRVYGKDFIQRLRKSFKVKEVKWRDVLTPKERTLMGITKHAGSLFHCTRKP